MNQESTVSAAWYLSSQSKLEPLLLGWYAWSHLAAPLQGAMNLANRYVPLLESFIKNPTIHINAARDPRMFGGPFINLERDSVAAVTQLLARIADSGEAQLRLARDVKALDEMLQQRTGGFCMNDLYAGIPASLRGFVEFVRDTNSHPRLRFLEELMLAEDFAAPAEEVMLSTLPDGGRDFFMSTPRLPGNDSLTLKTRFADEGLDVLAAMRTCPKPLHEVAAALRLTDSGKSVLTRHLTDRAPDRMQPEFAGDGVRVRYFGHACVLVQTAQASVLLDPMLAFERCEGVQNYTFADLPDRIDVVVITHAHQDHCSPEMLIQLRHRVGRVIVPRNNSGNIADPSLKLILKRLGFKNIEVVDAFDHVACADIEITSLPFAGEHVDLDIYTRHTLLITSHGRRFLFLVDSDPWDLELYRKISRHAGSRVDAVFVGMECHGAPLTWLYGPLLTRPISRRDDESRRLSGANCERAWNVISEFSPSQVFVYAMGQEPWLRYIMGLEYSPDSIQLKEAGLLVDKCRAGGMQAEVLKYSRELTYSSVL